MSLLEISAIFHISGSLFILFTLSTIINILFGDIIIKKLKLDEKFPRFLRLKKFTRFILIWNFFLIFMVLLTIIFINATVLYTYWF